MRFTKNDIIDILEKYPKESRQFLNNLRMYQPEFDEILSARYDTWEDFEDSVMIMFKLGPYQESIIKIKEDVQLPKTNIILEKGDRIKVLKE